MIGVIDVIMWFRKKTEKIWRCDWRDWRDYVIQNKNWKNFDAVIGVIDVIMWFSKKMEKLWRCDWRDSVIQ